MILLITQLLYMGEHGAAYLDPGSGSILIQILLGVLLAGGAIVGTLWGRIKSAFGKKEQEEDEDLGDE